jgi:hypothetical protein
MNVINIGGWYVGNTAILDWMDGFEELAFIKGDFAVARLEYGIMDMISDKLTLKPDREKDQEVIVAGTHKASRIKVAEAVNNLAELKESNLDMILKNSFLCFFILTIKE